MASIAMNSVSTETIASNKLKNEEFKIWKKVVPSLYQHISTFKPIFDNKISNGTSSLQSVAFTDKVVPDTNMNGILTTSVLYAKGSNIYEFDSQLPVGLYDQEASPNGNELPAARYNEQAIISMVEDTTYKPRWIWKDENIEKIVYLGSSQFIAMSTSGCVAWFHEESQFPMHTFINNENESESTADKDGDNDISMNGVHNERKGMLVDIDVSKNSKFIVISQSYQDGMAPFKFNGMLKVLSNEPNNVGNLIHTINISDGFVSMVKFINDDMIAACVDNLNELRIWKNIKDGNFDNIDACTYKLANTYGRIITIAVSPIIETLLALGTDNGVIQLYDLRTILCQDETKGNELVHFNHLQEDGVIDIQFSNISPFELISMGRIGNIYHWNLEYLFTKFSNEGAEKDQEQEQEIYIDQDELQRECLAFFHTGGDRRSNIIEDSENTKKRNTVAYHPLIDDLVACVDIDDLLTVYKPCTGKYQTIDNEGENEKPQE